MSITPRSGIDTEAMIARTADRIIDAHQAAPLHPSVVDLMRTNWVATLRVVAAQAVLDAMRREASLTPAPDTRGPGSAGRLEVAA